MADKVTTIRAAELVEDFALYPRHDVDDYHVSTLAESLRAGAILPPVIAERAGKRVIDGFHRRRATLRVDGVEAQIHVILRDYPDEAAMFLEAAKLNATHGRKLVAFDQVRCLVLGEKFGITRDTMAGVLMITKERADRLGNRQTADGIPLKNTMAHLAGQSITPAQQAFNSHGAGGKDQLFYVRQVIALLESESINLEDERLAEALQRLANLLNPLLVTGGVR